MDGDIFNLKFSLISDLDIRQDTTIYHSKRHSEAFNGHDVLSIPSPGVWVWV
jgi:hypothetical protein